MPDPVLPDPHPHDPRRAKPRAVAAGHRPAQRKRQQPHRRHWLDSAYGTLLLLLGLLAVARVAVGGPLPPVAEPGDRIVFGVRATQPPDIAIPAHSVAGVFAPAGAACVLNPATMAHRPGALTVIAARPDGVLLSWAGGPTASEAAGCAANATLLVTNTDYARLRDSQTVKR